MTTEAVVKLVTRYISFRTPVFPAGGTGMISGRCPARFRNNRGSAGRAVGAGMAGYRNAKTASRERIPASSETFFAGDENQYQQWLKNISVPGAGRPPTPVVQAAAVAAPSLPPAPLSAAGAGRCSETGCGCSSSGRSTRSERTARAFFPALLKSCFTAAVTGVPSPV
jgi:hypothetical protein